MSGLKKAEQGDAAGQDFQSNVLLSWPYLRSNGAVNSIPLNPQTVPKSEDNKGE
ncbi:hypothetical protein Vi05172_g11365 [Venturia inaequalis]|nr:hypothetical protein Vi05172_g11365 [Venturia inaequalis]